MSPPKAKSEKIETIKIPNSYFERVNTPVFQALMQKEIFKEVKPRYWLCRALDIVMRESRHYFVEKQKLIVKYSRKREADGEERDEKDKIVKKWKKDDPIILPSGEPDWEDFDAFLRDLSELQKIEIDLGINQVKFDDAPNILPNEMILIFPLLEEKENQD